MHLLAAKPGGFNDDHGIVDLQQTPADVVILSAQDSSLGLLAEVADTLPADWPSIRLANLLQLGKPAAYDLYQQTVLQHARVIIAAVLGGKSYWEYGVEQLSALAAQRDIVLVMVAGDDREDAGLTALSRCQPSDARRIWRYLRHGGSDNAESLFRFILERFFTARYPAVHAVAPRALPACRFYQPGRAAFNLSHWLDAKCPDKPTALLLFYRAHLQSGNTAAFDQLIAIMAEQFNLLSLAVVSLKHAACHSAVNQILHRIAADVVLNTTSFSQHVEGNAAFSSSPQLVQSRPFERDVPVIQAILAAGSRQDWIDQAQGLHARDIVMNVALPEYDGRIISRAISFKQPLRRSSRTEIDILRYQLHPERARFVVELARRWAMLAGKPNAAKRIALVLANYPTKDGRIGNGVGLDTPASIVTLLQALKRQGYVVEWLPENGDQLMRLLLQGVTNDLDRIDLKPAGQSLSRADYMAFFAALPAVSQQAVMQRWGAVEDDPRFRQGRIIISGVGFGGVFVGIQPERGFNLDLAASYHSPDLAPPHSYLAFYFWLRHCFALDAVAHVGKHGSLEWLPGKSAALSAHCWPDIALGPLPHLYPFIVNDPGEGTQAKRRAQAVILDHLMPPMARAETYGPMQELERLIDEYYQAAGLDQRRQAHLKQQILTLLTSSHLIDELALDPAARDDADALLNVVDVYLCELKEAQIRHGLHCFGQMPPRKKLPQTLVALTRLPRGEQQQDRGILHCLSADLALLNPPASGDAHFDPLDFDPAQPWDGARPQRLQAVSAAPWRTAADTRERLELLAEKLLAELLAERPICTELAQTAQLLEHIRAAILPAVVQCGDNEVKYFLHALNGGFVPPGPSGAPTRGRLDVLPTGRNFYSLDAYSIPTQAAWQLGWQSAEQLLLRHLQEHGDYPRQLGISVWGTSTMRTGGDDIAQALALLGVRPLWMRGSSRVVDIEIIPGFQLNRPRVDVTLRISGFFRDAFANVARLFDTAVQALADYEEPGEINTIRHNIQREQHSLVARGISTEQAERDARLRVFGSKPGSYGAGLQALINAGNWAEPADLAAAYIHWGGYSYTSAHFGEAALSAFERRLGKLQAVVQNQDNREHDLLDSDDYYQFQGGMANAVEVLSGRQPAIYHGDHANPASPKIRTLKEELNRVIRARVLNPKWINAMREHGYKGAFEMAASVDYLFAYDATTGLISDYQYADITDALVLDRDNQAFLKQANPDALKEMTERLLEAQQRGLWQQPGDYAARLTEVVLQIEQTLESAG